MSQKKYKWKNNLLDYLNLDRNLLYSKKCIYMKLLLKITGSFNIRKNNNTNYLAVRIMNNSIIDNVNNYGHKLKKLIL